MINLTKSIVSVNYKRIKTKKFITSNNFRNLSKTIVLNKYNNYNYNHLKIYK